MSRIVENLRAASTDLSREELCAMLDYAANHMEHMEIHLRKCADQLEYWKTNIPVYDDGNTDWCAKRARELAGEDK